MTRAQWLASAALPRLEARLLLEYVLKVSHVALLAHPDDVIAQKELMALNQLAVRRQKGEPMAYILGQKEFYGRQFDVNAHVLVPRPETEHLVEWLAPRLPENAQLWDLGAGSGVVAITVKLERPDVTVWASDVSDTALAVAQKNARRLDADIHWRQGDWFNVVDGPLSGSLDAVVSNPPYIALHDAHLQALAHEPLHALTDGADGLQALRTLALGAGKFLKPGGWLALEHGFDQGQAVRRLLEKAGFADADTIKDYANLERMTFGRWSD